MVMKRLHSLFILLIVYPLAVAPVAAQERPRVEAPPSTSVPVPDMNNAFQTRQMFQQLLRQYPPFLSEVFQLDPSLLANERFLSSYPNLSSFLAQHPEIVRNPSFFVGNLERQGQTRRIETPESRSRDLMQGIAMFIAGSIFLTVFSWVVKTVIDHRRWLRISKVQTEVHSKLMDRFSSNQDLLAYMQTSAGKNFLEFAPISIDPSSRMLTAPMNRILLCVQAGVILAFVGIGMHFVSRTVGVQEIAQPLFVLGALALALGVGFVVSAVVAYALSRRLGLVNQVPLPSRSDNAGVSPPHA
jgi:hypothetical protein